jgi:hypothetical protein
MQTEFTGTLYDVATRQTTRQIGRILNRFEGDPERLLILEQRHGVSALKLMDADGSHAVTLTHWTGLTTPFQILSKLLPGGRAVAISVINDNSKVFKLVWARLDGTQVTVMDRLVQMGGFAWVTDHQLWFKQYEHGQTLINVLDTETDQQKTVLRGSFSWLNPAFPSDDAQTIDLIWDDAFGQTWASGYRPDGTLRYQFRIKSDFVTAYYPAPDGMRGLLLTDLPLISDLGASRLDLITQGGPGVGAVLPPHVYGSSSIVWSPDGRVVGILSTESLRRTSRRGYSRLGGSFH